MLGLAINFRPVGPPKFSGKMVTRKGAKPGARAPKPGLRASDTTACERSLKGLRAPVQFWVYSVKTTAIRHRQSTGGDGGGSGHGGHVGGSGGGRQSLIGGGGAYGTYVGGYGGGSGGGAWAR